MNKVLRVSTFCCTFANENIFIHGQWCSAASLLFTKFHKAYSHTLLSNAYI